MVDHNVNLSKLMHPLAEKKYLSLKNKTYKYNNILELDISLLY